MVATAPQTIPKTAIKEPIDKVERPDRPCPIVQPRAVTPPKPIKIAPNNWARRSSNEANPSPFQRKLPDANAYAQEPNATPTAAATPKVTLSDVSVQSNNNSRL